MNFFYNNWQSPFPYRNLAWYNKKQKSTYPSSKRSWMTAFLLHITTRPQVVHIITKGLPIARFQNLRVKSRVKWMKCLRFICPLKWYKQFYPNLVVALEVVWPNRKNFSPNQYFSWMTETLAFELNQDIITSQLKYTINSFYEKTRVVFHVPGNDVN